MPQNINPNPEVITEVLESSYSFPNNKIPALVYKSAIMENSADMAALFEEEFQQHNWRNSWRNGIFNYHHYHSNTHEVLGIYSGSAKVQLGGPDGKAFDVAKGDMIVIPAGVAHKNLGASSDFACVGAYPNGRNYDMNDGSEDISIRQENIRKTPLPETDPLYGDNGPLRKAWH